MRFFLTVLTACFVFFSADGWAKTYSSAQIKRYVNKTPRDKENSVSLLAAYLAKPFETDYDKAKAIAFWIASRISYDSYLYDGDSATKLIKSYTGQSPKELLRSRVGICGDFAELFMALCRKANISAHIVHGYAYPSGQSLTASKRRNSGHAWNYFSYEGKKVYVDTTFMAKGAVKVSGSGGAMNHKRSLEQIKKANKTSSKINDNFDEFYFDFSYKEEKSKRNYARKEK